MTFGQLFTHQSKAYAAYRPTYPPALYDAVYAFAGLRCRELALDLGTGNGQVAQVLAQTFQRVVAQDPSPGQLREAAPAPNITYEEASAERTGLPARSVDLLTIAQALHWVDLPAFYHEARRVLKPEGSLAAWGYAMCFLEDARANARLQAFYNDTVGPFWDGRRRLVEAEYVGMEPGPEHFGTVERATVDIERSVTVPELVGYVTSWSAYTTMRREQPDAPDPLVPFTRELEGLLGPQPFRVRWPVFIVLAKQPVGL